jgi:hypothetical protein
MQYTISMQYQSIGSTGKIYKKGKLQSFQLTLHHKRHLFLHQRTTNNTRRSNNIGMNLICFLLRLYTNTSNSMPFRNVSADLSFFF